MEVESNTGPDSYSAGGFEVTSDTGRVDEVSVSADAAGYEARVAGVTDNVVTIEVYNQDGTGEVADATDLSGVSFTHQAYRL